MPHFLHQRFTKTIKSKLRGIVRRHLRMWICTGKGGDIDDVAPTSLLHERNRFVATVINSEQIGFEYGAKVVGLHLFNQSKYANARVIYEDVQATKFCDSMFD